MHFNKTQLATAVFAALVSTSAFADIKIAVLGPFTGGSQGMGIATRDGAALAAAEINSSGGILGGQKIVLVKYDEQGKASLGEQYSRDAVDKEKVVAAVGFANTGVAVKTISVFQKAGVPVILTPTSGTILTQTYKNEPTHYIFRNSAPDTLQTELVAKYAAEVRNSKRPAIFADSTPYGEQGLQQVAANLEKHGVRPIMVERFPWGKTDFEEAAVKARQLGADAIITWTLAAENAAIKNSFNRVGSRVPLMGSWTLSQKVYWDHAGLITNGTAVPITFTSDTEREVGQRFIKNYRNFHSVASIPSDMSAAQAYDAVYLIAKAITQAKSTDGKKIVDALENLDGTYEGAVMDYRKPFSKDDHDAFKSIGQIQMGIVKNGAIVRTK